MWTALGLICFFVVLVALVGVVVGLIIGIARKRWDVLVWSGVICGIAFVLFIIAVAMDDAFNDSESERISEIPPSSAVSNQPADTPVPTSPLVTSPTPTPEPTSTPAATSTPEPIKLSATDLVQAYEDNEVAAKSKYEGETALITGEVSSITEAGSKYDVKLRPNAPLSWSVVVCKVNREYEASILPLKSGQITTVLGIIKGKGISDIVVESCMVQP